MEYRHFGRKVLRIGFSGFVPDDLVPAVPFSKVEGAVSAFEIVGERVDVAGKLAHLGGIYFHHSHGDRDFKSFAGILIGERKFFNGRRNAFGCRHGSGLARFVEKHDELFSSPTAGNVDSPRHVSFSLSGKDVAKFRKDFVSHEVSVRIVHSFEVIDVEQAKNCRIVGSPHPLDGVFEKFFGGVFSKESGELVETRVVKFEAHAFEFASDIEKLLFDQGRFFFVDDGMEMHVVRFRDLRNLIHVDVVGGIVVVEKQIPDGPAFDVSENEYRVHSSVFGIGRIEKRETSVFRAFYGELDLFVDDGVVG